jgi:hypothetical protein
VVVGVHRGRAAIMYAGTGARPSQLIASIGRTSWVSHGSPAAVQGKNQRKYDLLAVGAWSC